jgi:uncharacterized membrane protein
MKKWIIIIMVMLVMPLTLAEEEVCKSTVELGKNCTVLTPVLACSGNYTIFNESGNVKNGSMTLIGGGKYKFNFNETEGNYVITLCDNTTRQIIVEASDAMQIAITLGLSVMAIIFVTIGLVVLFKKKEDDD